MRRARWLPILALLLLMLVGCTRKYYRNFADRDVYRIERSRAIDWRWQLPPRPVEADPRSRIGDRHNPNREPIPPDDPGARPYQVTAGRPFEFVGWKSRGMAPVEDLSWLQSIPREPDGTVLLNAESAMQIAVMNSRDYQTQIENVYIAALNLTLARFSFFPKVSSVETEQYRQAGAGKNQSRQLQLITQDALTWTFYSGANLLVNFANTMIFEFNGKGFQTVTSPLLINFVQPLLQGAWARNVTQPLSLQERGVLYAIRNFASFRRQFYVNTVTAPLGYLGLMTQLQAIRNQESQLEALKRNLDELEASAKAGLVEPLQRDQLAQTYQQSRLQLLQQQASFETSLDAFRVNQLGLPADFPIKVDETLLKKFELNDKRLDDLKDDNNALYLGLLQHDEVPGKDVMVDAARKLRGHYAILRSVADQVGTEMARWQAQIERDKARALGRPGPIEADERASLERQIVLQKDLAASFSTSRAALDNMHNLDEYVEKLGTTDPLEAWSKLRQQFLNKDFRARLAEQFVIETQVRVYLIEVTPVDLTLDQAISVALANRLDLMTNLAIVTDTWRNVEFDANQLLAGLSVFYQGQLNTNPHHKGIFDYDAHNSIQLAGVQFTAPIYRRQQRNQYRFDQINFQRARRQYMLNHDQIVQAIRLDLRNLNLNRRQFEITREALLISARQVDSAEYNARTSTGASSGAGSTAGINLTNALNSLLGNKNQLIGNWVQYESQRIDLFKDFDIININAQGVWTNDSNVPVAPDGGPVPTTPDPLSPGPQSIYPGPAARPDPAGAGAGPPVPSNESGPAVPPPPAPAPPAPAPSRARRRNGWKVPVRLLVLLAGAGGVAAFGFSGISLPWSGPSDKDKPITVPISRGTLRIIVTERGNLESVKTVDGVCELNANQIKIIQLTPEGNHVEKGDIVCRFDSSEIDKNIAQQEIKAKQAASKIETSKQEVEIARNKGESDIIAATVELTLADLDLEMYQKGTYVFETDEIRGDIGLKIKKLEESKNTLEQIQGLVKKGFKSPGDLRAAQSQLDGDDLTLRGAKAKLMVKEKYEYKRKSTEFSSKVDQSRSKVAQAKATLKASLAKTESEYDSAKSTFTIEDQQLKEFLKQKEKTTIKAEQSGVIAYANEPWYDSSRQIREGASVYSRQRIFSLPDMSQMQVKVSIHESLVKKIKPGLRCEIRVDAFPNLVIVGKVKTVSQLADSNRGWLSGGVKEYATIVAIDQMPKEELRPSMTSEVKIMVGELSNVLVAPVQSVALHKGKFYAFSVTPKGIERKEVKVGETNEFQVQILEGLTEGEHVALDARARAEAAFKNEGGLDDGRSQANTKETAPPAGK